jgi:hypothetical protein
MTPEEIFTALSQRDGFPREAMIAAGQCREEMVPIFLEQINRLSQKPITSSNDPDVSAFLFTFFLLGEWREQRAYRPLTSLLRRDEKELDYLIGDAVTEGAARVIAAVFDGDLQPIFEVLEDPEADMFARSQMIDALVTIAGTHSDCAIQVRAWFERFFEADFDKPDVLWDSWSFAVAELALAHLEPQVREAFERGYIDPMSITFEHFQRDLTSAIETGQSTWYHRSRTTKPIDSAVEELSQWYCFSDDYLNGREAKRASNNPFLDSFGEPFLNDGPKVGRNDPCPCGSGKKYKKCCLH